MAEIVLSKKAKAKVKELRDKLDVARSAVTAIEEEIEETMQADSPIQPNDRIEWQTGGWLGSPIKKRQGVVIALASRWDGYDYKVQIFNKDWTKAIGVAKVSTDHFPTLVGTDDGTSDVETPNPKARKTK